MSLLNEKNSLEKHTLSFKEKIVPEKHILTYQIYDKKKPTEFYMRLLNKGGEKCYEISAWEKPCYGDKCIGLCKDKKCASKDMYNRNLKTFYNSCSYQDIMYDKLRLQSEPKSFDAMSYKNYGVNGAFYDKVISSYKQSIAKKK